MVFRARKSQQALCLHNPIHHRHSMSTAADLASSAVTAPMGIQQVNLFILISYDPGHEETLFRKG